MVFFPDEFFPPPKQCGSYAPTAGDVPDARCINVAEYVLENDISWDKYCCQACLAETLRRATLYNRAVLVRRVDR